MSKLVGLIMPSPPLWPRRFVSPPRNPRNPPTPAGAHWCATRRIWRTLIGAKQYAAAYEDGEHEDEEQPARSRRRADCPTSGARGGGSGGSGGGGGVGGLSGGLSGGPYCCGAAAGKAGGACAEQDPFGSHRSSSSGSGGGGGGDGSGTGACSAGLAATRPVQLTCRNLGIKRRRHVRLAAGRSVTPL